MRSQSATVQSPTIIQEADGGIFDANSLPIRRDVVQEYQAHLRQGTLSPAEFRGLFRAVRDSEPSDFRAACRVDRLFDELVGMEKPRSTTLNQPFAHGYVGLPLLDLMKIFDADPRQPGDELCDIGAGLCRVPLFAHLWTGQPTFGVEIQEHLLSTARRALNLSNISGVTLLHGDARLVQLPHADIFFLYQPFGGPVLEAFLSRLQEVASVRPITVWWVGFNRQCQDISKSWLRWSKARLGSGQDLAIGKNF